MSDDHRWAPVCPAVWSNELSEQCRSLPGDKFFLWPHQASALSFFQPESPGEIQFLRDHCFNFLITKGQGSLEGLHPSRSATRLHLSGLDSGLQDARICLHLFFFFLALLAVYRWSPHSSLRSPGEPSPGAGAGLLCSQPLKRAAAILPARVEGLKRRFGTKIALFHKQSCFSLERM